MTPREQVLRLVRRARVRLEAARLLKASARGALAGGAAGLACLLAMKLVAAWPVVPGVAWGLLVAGALSGLLRAVLVERSIGPVAAALFLDRRLRARERFVTVLTCPPGARTDRIALGLVALIRLPRIPFPREAALVPAAFFLLFAAGLLPAAGAAQPPSRRLVVVPAGSGAGGAGAEAVEVDPEALRELLEGQAPDPARAEQLDAAIEGLHRPEERKAARDALERAQAGDAGAARDLARTLRNGYEEGGGGLLQGSAYPEATEFVRQYRRAVSKE